jgi:chromosome partitioning protein
MLTVSSVSLAGGQGKSTIVLFLARYLIDLGAKVLVVDADPQSSLTTFLRFQVESDSPTLLEVIKKQVDTKDGIYETKYTNLYLIPSDDALDTVQDYLAGSGTGALTLARRLKPVSKLFDYCLIDSPPQRSQITLTVVGASDGMVIPVEASVKGLQSLIRTLDLISSLKEEDEEFGGSVIGIVPFRDRWVGTRRTNESQSNIESMQELSNQWFGRDLILPTIRESEKFKQAINQGLTLHSMGYADLAYPFEVLAQKFPAIEKVRR